MAEAQKAKDAFAEIWAKWAEDRKQNRATAYANLQQALARNATEVVPAYYTAKEFGAAITDFEEYTKGDKQSESGNPVDTMSDWLAGKIELSRIPLEERKKIQ